MDGHFGQNPNIDFAAAAVPDEDYKEVLEWTETDASPRLSASSTSPSLAVGVTDGQDLGTLLSALGMTVSTPTRQATDNPMEDDKPEGMPEASLVRFSTESPGEFMTFGEHDPSKR